MDHVYSYAPEVERRVGFAWQPYLGLFLLTFGVALMGAAGFWRWQAQRSATAVSSTNTNPVENDEQTALNAFVNESELGNPAEQKVAGINTTNNGPGASFGLVGASRCNQELFLIGDKESSPLNNPGDEFNWLGALDVLPEAVDPFVVGEQKNSDFPWRTSLNEQGETINRIQFNVPEDTIARLTIGWLPGGAGKSSKLVYLDDQLIGSTPTVSGEFTPASWQNMSLRQDVIDLAVTGGQHLLSITSIDGGTDPSVWDFIELAGNCR